MRWIVIVLGITVFLTNGCVAVTARDNKISIDRKRQAVTLGDRMFLVNTKTGQVTELHVPEPGEGTSAPVFPDEVDDDDDTATHQKTSAKVEVHEERHE